MSIDTVDDLHHAEDMLGVVEKALEDAARDLHLFHARGPAEDCRKEACVRVRQAIAVVANYCRPSCETDDDDGSWLCDADCGCPAEHDGRHGQEP